MFGRGAEATGLRQHDRRKDIARILDVQFLKDRDKVAFKVWPAICRRFGQGNT